MIAIAAACVAIVSLTSACRPADSATSPAKPVAANEVGPVFDRVLMISVDGLRSDALMALGREEGANFRRLLSGAYTFNARTDADWTVTLPNHTCMITGRPVEGAMGHRWLPNTTPPENMTLHTNAGEYVAGAFDVAHDHGVHTAMAAEKAKFVVYDRSWDGRHGAMDATGGDNGRDKIDFAFVPANDDRAPDSSDTTKSALEQLVQSERALVFLHYGQMDFAGHSAGWDLTPGSVYLRAGALVNSEVGKILDAIEADDRLRGRTAVIVTADHGGGMPHASHTDARFWVNYIIPFIVWTGDERARGDLYEINRLTRRDPSIHAPAWGSEIVQPIRNGEMGNLALWLMGLPPIPGSSINGQQDLRTAMQMDRRD